MSHHIFFLTICIKSPLLASRVVLGIKESDSLCVYCKVCVCYLEMFNFKRAFRRPRLPSAPGGTLSRENQGGAHYQAYNMNNCSVEIVFYSCVLTCMCFKLITIF